MPSADSGGWRLRTVTLAPASRSRCATGRPSVPVPPVTRIDVAITSPFTGKARLRRTSPGAAASPLLMSFASLSEVTCVFDPHSSCPHQLKYLLLGGILAVVVDGAQVGDLGPGAVVGNAPGWKMAAAPPPCAPPP